MNPGPGFRRGDGGGHFTVSVVLLSFTESGPEDIVNVPGSTTRFMSRFHSDRSRGVSSKVTVFFSPGFRLTRSKRYNSFTGRVTLARSSRT